MTGPGRAAPTVLITGARGGIGRVTAEALSATGHRLLLTSRSSSGATSSTLAAHPYHAADLTRVEQVRALADWAMQEGPPDVVVLNAGTGWAGPLPDMSDEEAVELLTLDLAAPVVLTRRLLPSLVERRGHLVLVASIAAHLGVRDEAVYSAAKGGLLRFAEALRHEVAADGVAVSVVSPGAVDTAFFTRRGRPYGRSWPRPVPPERVAVAIARTLQTRRDEVFVPAWMRLPARLNAAAPALTARLTRRFG